MRFPRLADRWMGSGAVLILLAATCFSVKSIFIKLAYRHGVDAATLLALRMGFSLPFFLAVAAVKWRGRGGLATTRRDWAGVIAMGLLGHYFASYLDFLGLKYISAGLERLILFLYPTLVVLLSAHLAGARISRREVAATALSYAGIAMAVYADISVQQPAALMGSGLVFVSAVCFAIYLVGSEALIAKLGAAVFTATAMTVSCAAVMVHFAMTHEMGDLRLPAPVYGWAAAMALVSTVLPAFLVSAGIRRLGAGRAAVVSSMGPIITIALGHLVLGEATSTLQLAGAVLVCAGVYAVTRRA
ncbi:MAG: DMT family transporter [Gammaproteobacteria bacterium]